MTTSIYAGHLCATHVGEPFASGEVSGTLHKVIHEQHKRLVRVVVYGRGSEREDGSVRKTAHLLDLDPRDVVAVNP